MWLVRYGQRAAARRLAASLSALLPLLPTLSAAPFLLKFHIFDNSSFPPNFFSVVKRLKPRTKQPTSVE
jgi:hypothetical protein